MAMHKPFFFKYSCKYIQYIKKLMFDINTTYAVAEKYIDIYMYKLLMNIDNLL